MEIEPRKPAWPVYAVTAAMVPLTFISATIVFSIAAVVVSGGDMMSSEEIQALLEDQLSKGATGFALSIGANALAFTLVPLILALSRVNFETATLRLGLTTTSPVDILLATTGLLALTSALDAVVQLTGLSSYGALAEMRETMLALPDNLRMPLAFVVAIGAGIPEELFFRGYVLRRLSVSQGKTVALFVSALLFGLFHFDPLHAPLAAMMGLALGYVTLKTGSIYPAIVAHLVNNGVAVLAVKLEIPPAYTWPVLLGSLLLAAASPVLIARRHRGEEQPIVW